jgi:endogenous inhibitor of DNA gyrase (YacG/DUF329 family)
MEFSMNHASDSRNSMQKLNCPTCNKGPRQKSRGSYYVEVKTINQAPCIVVVCPTCKTTQHFPVVVKAWEGGRVIHCARPFSTVFLTRRSVIVKCPECAYRTVLVRVGV